MQVNAQKIITAIANAHPESVRLLYKSYGIDAEVSPRSLYDAVVAYGKPFYTELIKMVRAENPKKVKQLVFAEGDTPTTSEPTFWEKVTTAVGALSSIAVTGAGAYDQTRDLLADELNQNELSSALYLNSLEQQAAFEAAQRKQQLYIFGGLGVALIAVIFIIAKNR